MGALDPPKGPVMINIEDELEGEQVGTTDYFFVKIGEAVPLKNNDSDFDLQSLPCHPLAVSERFRLIFVAHSSGFFVVRTKDVIDSAKEFKEKGNGLSIEQLSLVDVSIGRVHILSLSTDNSIAAASISGNIRFFSVDNFLNKEVKQSFSCSLNDSAFVKDMRWITTSRNSYVVLSNTGELYYGEIGSPLKQVMDNVDAVDWGVNGTFVAVARKNVLSILSAKFEERVSVSLSFKSWIRDPAENCSIKVDSVKCVRPDSIVVGCFQVIEGGIEENYLLQVIRSRTGEISDVCSGFVVQSFYDIYQGLIDDIVPFGSGPYLLLTYIKQCQLAINANIKNTDQHIVLLGWSVNDDKSEAAIVDIERDNCVPRIELQENGDDNLLLGLCIDNVSIDQKVGVQLGTEERTELSPYCLLICLTMEGKLVMFHVASPAGSAVSPEVVSGILDEEDAYVKLTVEGGSTFSHELQKQESDQASEVSGNMESKPFANPYQMTQTEDSTKYREVESVANLQSLKSNVCQKVRDVDVSQETDNRNPPSGDQQTSIDQKTAALGTSMGSFAVNSHSATSGLLSYNNLKNTTEKNKVLWNTSSSSDAQRTSNLLPSETFSFPKDSVVSLFSTSSYADGAGNQKQVCTAGATNVHTSNVTGSIGGKPFLLQDVNSVSPAVNSTSRSVERGGQLTSSIGAGTIQPVPVSSSYLLSNENTTAGKSSIRKFHPSNEQHGTSSKLGISNSDLSKQCGNINEMTKELDLLLRSIEEPGGFRDSCTQSLRSSIGAVEHEIDKLSDKCKIWTCQVDEHLEEVCCVLNNTIQVVARKIYMESIYKQASDRHYWDLWNRQKLNSELELKRQHILSLNQDLTCQLIALERHFNALELNKFSQYGGSHMGHGTFQSRHGPSRYVQSLHSLHNSISSQLVAAENLSECLSKQMTDLCLKSSSEEQKNVKELFETIGIPYDASFGSPDMKGFIKTSSSKQLLFSDLTNKDQRKSIQASIMKNCEPEMARRRRDSLVQSWTCFEPTKTTIKRMPLLEHKPNWNRSFSSINKEKVKTSMLKEPDPRQTDSGIPSIAFPASKMKVRRLDSHIELEDLSEHPPKATLAQNLQAPTQFLESISHDFQRNNISAVPSWPASQLSPAMIHDHSTRNNDLTSEKPSVQKFDSISDSENKSFLHTETPPNFSVSTYSTVEYSEMPLTISKMTLATSSPMGNKLPSAFTPESWEKQAFATSGFHSSTASAASYLLGKVPEFNVDKSQSDKVNSAQPTSSPFESLSSATVKTSSASPLPSSVSSAAARSWTSSNPSTDSSRNMPTSSTSAYLSVSNQAPKHTLSSLHHASSLNSMSESHKSEIQPAAVTSESHKSEIQPAAVSTSKTNLDASAEVVTLSGESELKLGSAGKFTPTNVQSFSNLTDSVVAVDTVSQPEQPSDAPMKLSTSFLASTSVSSGKNGGTDVGISYEDEMEEEAPETENTTELGLGNLGGFGSSSIHNTSMPRPNPFGASYSNVATSFLSSPIPFSSPGGELFRPASFSFPSPQSSAPAQSTNSVAFSGGFSGGATAPAPVPGGFGQPAQIGSGQQVLGSVLGTFGQSRQLGNGLPGSCFAAPGGFSGGFAGSTTSGFPSASTGGGFAGIASTGGGFAGVASTGSGFSGMASVGGFAGGPSTSVGFAAVSSTGGFAGAASGGGLGAFSSQGSGGFATFGTVAGGKPPELFTQMRK